MSIPYLRDEAAPSEYNILSTRNRWSCFGFPVLFSSSLIEVMGLAMLRLGPLKKIVLLEVVFLFNLAALFFLGVVSRCIPLSKEKIRFSSKLTWIYATYSFCHRLIYFRSLTMVGFGDTVSIFSVSCILSAILGCFFLQKRLRCLDFAAFLSCILGVLLITRPYSLFSWAESIVDISQPTEVESVYGYPWVFLATVTKAIGLIVFQYAVARDSWDTIIMIEYVTGLLVSGTAWLCVGSYDFDIDQSNILLLVLAAGCCIVANSGYSFGSPHMNSFHIAVVTSFDKHFAYCLAVFMLNEDAYILSLIGAFAIWLGSILQGYETKVHTQPHVLSGLTDAPSDIFSADDMSETTVNSMDLDRSSATTVDKLIAQKWGLDMNWERLKELDPDFQAALNQRDPAIVIRD